MRQDGFILPATLALGFIMIVIGIAVATIAVSSVTYQTHEARSLSALNIAEAGINYYLWHLSHNAADYKDGGTTPSTPPYGPYVHNYTDPSGTVIGTFTLYITPPAVGSTVTTVKSVGQVTGLHGTRTILAQLGLPSFANYVLLTGTEVWFGPGENANGPVHSNVGVHMDGTNNGAVSAANATYKPTPAFGGDGAVHNGVWGNGGPASQWQYPVPPIDFSKVTADYSNCISQAQSGGVFLDTTNKKGYYLHLKTDGSIDIYTVKNETSSGITTTFVRNQAYPDNGILYVQDNVWVDGTGYPKRLNILSGRLPDLPATNTTVTVVNNLTYAAKDGSAVVGLIAQKDVVVPTYAPNDIEIDAAVLAQKGHVFYPNSGSVKNNLIFYGSIDSYDFWTWSWVNGGGTVISGYPTSTTSFDTNLTYGPPPCYPTTGTFAVLNWRELLFSP
jgi:hypothetical protein